MASVKLVLFFALLVALQCIVECQFNGQCAYSYPVVYMYDNDDDDLKRLLLTLILTLCDENFSGCGGCSLPALPIPYFYNDRCNDGCYNYEYNNGCSNGYNNECYSGYNGGCNNGCNAGYNNGCNGGYNNGCNGGYNNGFNGGCYNGNCNGCNGGYNNGFNGGCYNGYCNGCNNGCGYERCNVYGGYGGCAGCGRC